MFDIYCHYTPFDCRDVFNTGCNSSSVHWAVCIHSSSRHSTGSAGARNIGVRWRLWQQQQHHLLISR